MECNYYEKIISKLIDGEASDRENNSLERHLSGCKKCSHLYSIFFDINKLHQALDEVEPPHGTIPSVIESIKTYKRKIMIHDLSIRFLVPAATVLIIIVGVKVGNILYDSINPNHTYHAEVLKLEYLDEYPPDSAGDILTAAMEGGIDD